MLTSFLLFFVCYFLVVFVALLGIFWQDSRFFWLAGINFVALLIFFFVSFLLKKKEHSLQTSSEEASQEEKVRSSQHFVKYPYMKHEKKTKTFVGYLLFFSVFLFLFSVLDLTLFHTLGQFIWIFPLLYLFLLFIAGKDLIDNKIRIFGIPFDFYFFLFVSSLIVGVLVYGTLIFSLLPILLLSALLVSFLFFFVGYIFIKNQGIRFFFRLSYARVYFVAILAALIRSFVTLPSNQTLSTFSTNITSFFQKMFTSSENKDPLLLTGEGQVINSGTTIVLTGEEEILEETGHVVTSGVNSVFLSDDEETTTGDVEESTGVALDQNNANSIKETLGIKDTDTISMGNALRFLMEANTLALSEKTTTKFTYVSKTNVLYPYWQTAYEKKIIGASTNPSTKITCETYQVFKGMVLGWDLVYSPATVKKVFWAEAEKQDMLKGCVYGKLLKGENL